MFPGSHVRKAGYRGHYTEAIISVQGSASGHVEAYGDASTLKLELRGIPVEVALRMLEVLAEGGEQRLLQPSAPARRRRVRLPWLRAA
jgi:hypothetical protein